MNKKKKAFYWLALLVIASLLTTQCTPAAPPATQAPVATQAPATQAPATGGDYSQAPRQDTVIFDIDGGKVADPTNWNPVIQPGFRLDQGYHQSMIEPLFILNYETGNIEPWLGTSMTPNDTLDVWTLKLRDGVTWSDGQPMNADDVVFTIKMLQDNAPTLWHSAEMKDWVKDVKKVDNLTVEFDLTRPNPRFQLDYFSVRIWGGVSILPKHIWEN